ncbi:hypothetical protein SESBI_29924 [Sesbania bispinosa]|nr:hypothetical protein SESBI_29924 [Sesbania bispinosa]
MAEKTGEMAAEMEDVSHVEVAGEMEEYRPDDVVVEEALEEGTVSDIGSDSYESAEDSLYRPSLIVSEVDEEDSPVVAEIRSKKKNDVAARSTDKGNVVADSSNKKGKNVVADSSNKKGKNVVDDSSKRKGKNVDAVTSSKKRKKKVVDSSKRRRVVTSEESSEDDGEVQNNRLKRSYPECICSRCGHPNHNIRNCMNYGVPPKPRGWKPVETTEVPAADGTTTPVNPTTTTENANETQSEIDLSQSQPLSQNASSSPTTAANQTSAVGAFVGGNPSTRPTTISPTSVAGPYLGPSSSSRPTTISPSAVAGPFQGANAPGPSSTAGPFQGASASTCTRFMQFMPTPGFRPPPPKKP